MVLSSPGYMSTVVSTGDLARAGGIKAWRGSGEPISLSGSTNVPALLMESSGGAWLKAAPATLADIDHDGKLDIIAASVQDRTYLPLGEKSTRKNRSSIYVWQLDVPFKPEHSPWPAFQRNAQHTGYFPAPPRIDQPPVISRIPDQIVAVGGAFFPIELDQYMEDPDDPAEAISWIAAGQSQLQVQISSNRVATVEAPSGVWAGKESIVFTATDPGGLRAEAHVTFEARPGYVAPVAGNDRLEILEDTDGEIDVLANDTDPAGFPLQIISYSNPRRGGREEDQSRHAPLLPEKERQRARQFQLPGLRWKWGLIDGVGEH